MSQLPGLGWIPGTLGSGNATHSQSQPGVPVPPTPSKAPKPGWVQLMAAQHPEDGLARSVPL